MIPASWTPPARAYAICSLPRSGSNLLCALLEANGAGRPRELFHESELAKAPADKAAWMARQRQRPERHLRREALPAAPGAPARGARH